MVTKRNKSYLFGGILILIGAVFFYSGLTLLMRDWGTGLFPGDALFYGFGGAAVCWILGVALLFRAITNHWSVRE